jgi:transposase
VDRDSLQMLLASGLSFEEIGRRFRRHPSTISYWARRHGLISELQAKHAPKGGLDRYRVEVLIADGLSISRMANRLGVSESTVQYWLRKWGLKTARAERMKAACRADAVARRRRRVKTILVREAGGRCRLCGYSRCPDALHFHHVDPSTKSFSIGARGLTRSLDLLRKEAAKCALLCANCHAEVEAGIVTLAVEGDPHGT